ncbi:hypothetical protein QP162_22115 [Sphingomonas aurantiaca]|uniref:hypothetical protein n=1 Tax=Sphingomonas aurantiaca TaxID=185949 RepID=UPI002FE0B732
MGKDLPQVDLPDLERFFTGVIARHGRRVFKRDDGLEVKSPDAWMREDYALAERYEGLAFDRALGGARAASRVVGVGHRLFDRAMREAQAVTTTVGHASRLEGPLLIVAIEDEVTGTGVQVGRIVLGLYDRIDGPVVLRDWELLKLLNGVGPSEAMQPVRDVQSRSQIASLMAQVNAVLSVHAPLMTRPKAWPEMLIIPEDRPA